MRTRLILGSLSALFVLFSRPAQALPGTHAPAISTYDTRASSVVLAYRHGSSDAGPFNSYSYNANFSSTTGKLSAQFGIHYLNFASKLNNATAHGAGASGVALFVFPVAGRYSNGVPKAAISFDIGAVPTVYVSSQRNYLTVPLVVGFGVPLSPFRALTITPWFELAPSANLDTIFKPADINVGPDAVTVTPNPVTNTVDVKLNQGAVEAAVKKGVTIDYGFSVPMRVGLEAGIHLGESADLNGYASISSLGGGFSGSSVISLGAGLVFRWDDMVPAVLPAERRLEREGCDVIETRFRSCPNSRQWLSPEQRSRGPNSSAMPPAVSHVAPSATLTPALERSTVSATPPAPLLAVTPTLSAREAVPPAPAPPSAVFPN